MIFILTVTYLDIKTKKHPLPEHPGLLNLNILPVFFQILCKEKKDILYSVQGPYIPVS